VLQKSLEEFLFVVVAHFLIILYSMFTLTHQWQQFLTNHAWKKPPTLSLFAQTYSGTLLSLPTLQRKKLPTIN